MKSIGSRLRMREKAKGRNLKDLLKRKIDTCFLYIGGYRIVNI